MKKLLMLLTIVAATSYSSEVILDVNANLVKPLSIEANTKRLEGQVTNAGGYIKFSVVDLLVTGESGRDVKIVAPKDITLHDATNNQDVVLQSKFENKNFITAGTNIELGLSLNQIGEASATYFIDGNVVSGLILNANHKAIFEGDADITVAYN